MRITPHSWRYLLPLMLLPAAVLVLLALRQARAEDLGMEAPCRSVIATSVDGQELLLQFVGTQEIQRQAQHQVDALFE